MKNTDPTPLAERLHAAVKGEVLFGAGDRAMYATDASNYRRVPIGVVRPRDREDVTRAMRICREHEAAVLPRGGGTSLAGQCCNVAVVLDFSRHMNRVLEIDPQARTARVQPGTVLDDLRAAARVHGLTYGPDPATHDRCTIGGMIGNNSCGIHSMLSANRGPGARTEDNTVSLDIHLWDGTEMRVGPTPPARLDRLSAGAGRESEIYNALSAFRDRHEAFIGQGFPDIPRRVSGYNLPALLEENGFDLAHALVGTEGTCAVVLEATVRLIEEPDDRALVVLAFPDVYAAADAVPGVLDHEPIGLEGLDDRLIDDMRETNLHTGDLELLPEGGGWLLVEMAGHGAESASDQAYELVRAFDSGDSVHRAVVYGDPAEVARVWEIRESALGATAFVPGDRDTWPGWEDAAVPPEQLGGYLRRFRELLERHGYECSLYGHFGQGCVHTRIDFEFGDRAGLDRYLAFIEDAADLVVEHGGSLSGEHGDGVARAGLLDRMYGAEGLQAFREFKGIWDPDGKMNPGRIVDPDPPDQYLYRGAGSVPRQLPTMLAYPEDNGSFGRAAGKCIGVGKCRRTGGGTMCPSYMVTREERHSTRGRARLLNEMLRGEVIRDGWRSDEVRKALDLCLACKGCKSDCPVDVDMATYKAEFLSHYYKGRLRPRSAYSMGLIHWWARLAAHMPRFANRVAGAPVLGRFLHWAGGISPQRELPTFAHRTFRSWWRHRQSEGTDGAPVILWPDTFNDHFHPEVLRAAAEVLERAGFTVRVPAVGLCCGRPLYDYGMLDLAKRKLAQVLDALRADLRAGTPVVGTEPSCVAVFRDELQHQFPEDADARRLREQTFLLSEFLARHAPSRETGYMPGRALVHMHCHQHAVLDEEATRTVLEDVGLEVEVIDSGCCGMAGSFGFEREHYDVAQACAERALLPAVRSAGAGTWLVTDGFSCREMLIQNGSPGVRHSSEILRYALDREHAPLPA